VIPPDRREDLHKMQRPIVVDVLNWIVENERLQTAPAPG
jgi:hypothetical protein